MSFLCKHVIVPNLLRICSRSVSLPTLFLSISQLYVSSGLVTLVWFFLPVFVAYNFFLIFKLMFQSDAFQITSKNRSTKSSTVMPEQTMQTFKQFQIPKQRIIQFLGRICLPIMTAAFILIYLFVAIYMHNNPNVKYWKVIAWIAQKNRNKIIHLVSPNLFSLVTVH